MPHFLRLIALITISVVFAVPAAEATSSYGRTNGQFAVSPTGAAQYSVPIWVPPGPRGIQPHLSIDYNNQAGPGTLGPGWQLNGLSSIVRCDPTFAQDGAAAPVVLGYGDRYCLDGKRLRLTSGPEGEFLPSYGLAGTTYQTEIADFSLTTAYGQVYDSLGMSAGPQYFVVQGKDGLTYEYGNTNTTGAPNNGSQVLAGYTSIPFQWLLDKVSDRYGNNYVITYTAPNSAVGVGLPSTISFVPTTAGATTYSYTVNFTYETRTTQNSSTHLPAITGAVAGSTISNPNLLTKIAVSYGSTTLRVYNLGYTASATTSQALLTSLTECAGSAGTNCLLASTFSYQAGAAGVPNPTISVATGSLKVIATRDFNGDGRDDILYLNTSNNDLYVAFSTIGDLAGSFSAPYAVGVAGAPGTLCYGDVLGIGRSDIFVPISNVFWRYTWNASTSTFTATNTGVALDAGATWAALIDINGDGLADLVTANLSYPVNVYSRLNIGAGSTVSFSSTEYTYTTPNPCGVNFTCTATIDASGGLKSKLQMLDFDGDGRADIAIHVTAVSGTTTAYSHALLVSNGTSFIVNSSFGGGGPTYVFLNANYDNCTDFADNTGLTRSACNGSIWGYTAFTGTPVGALDWDGDGLDDVLIANGTTLGILESTGSGTSSLITTTIPYTANSLFVFDPNGDGQAALGSNNYITGGNITYALHNGAGQPPDLATTFVDGYNLAFTASYASVAVLMGESQYNFGVAQTYPYVGYSGPMYVAQSVIAPDGIGSTFALNYLYQGAVLNLQGRGFQGFGQIEVIDTRNYQSTYNYYGTAFPESELWTRRQVHESYNFTLISASGNTWLQLTLDNTPYNQRYLPYVSSSAASQYEVQPGGTYDGQLITQIATVYSTPDNYGNFASTTTTVTDKDSGSPYYNQQWSSTVAMTVTPDTGANWCLNLPTEVDTTNTAPGVPSITRHISYTPNYSACRETGNIVEPSNPSYQVTTGYLFDAFGNVKSQTVTGVGMAARTSTADWGSNGKFPTTTTNALTQTSHASFDPNTGQQLSATDANGIVTSWLYDVFGRRIQETRPDGTMTTWAYNSCATAGCVNPNNKMTIVQTNLNKDSSTLRTSNAYLDWFDRTLITSKQLVSGAYDRKEVQYDNRGNVLKAGSPCLFASCTPSSTYWTTNTYDPINRLLTSQRPISATNSTLQTTTFTYSGRTKWITDAYRHNTQIITKVTGWAGQTQDNNGYYVAFNQDAFGSVLSITDSLSNTLRTMTYAYGMSAFLKTSTKMDQVSTQPWAYTYDALGELINYTDSKSQSVSFSYDALSRTKTRTEPESSGSATTTWNWGGSASSYNIGKLSSVGLVNSTGTFTHAYSYDSDGRLSSDTTTLPSGQSEVFSYAFDPNTGLPSSLTYPASYPTTFRFSVGYAYQNGLLHHVFDEANAATIWWRVDSVNAAGQATQESSQYAAGDPELIQTRAFDAVTGWLSSIQSGAGGGSGLQNQSYTYDEMGNVTQRQDTNSTRGVTENFYYDNLYRLDHSTLGGTTNLQMCYDNPGTACNNTVAGPGNISSRSDVAGGAAWTYDPTHKHQVTQAGSSSYTYTYDANGNAATRNGQTIGWTSYNYPSEVSTSTESASFDYGPDRQRWRMVYTGSSGTETTYYASSMFEQVASSSGNDYRHYVYANGRAVGVVSHTSGGVVNARSLLVDQQGSVASIVNQTSGANVVSESFTAYGNRREASTWTGAPTSGELTAMNGVTREGYTFQTVLGSMGLNHMNGRIEDAVTGRFLSLDQNGTNLASTQSFNPYSYVLNNPLSLSDPTGFRPAWLCGDYCPNHSRSPCNFGCGNSGDGALGGITGYTYSDDLPNTGLSGDFGGIGIGGNNANGGGGGSGGGSNGVGSGGGGGSGGGSGGGTAAGGCPYVICLSVNARYTVPDSNFLPAQVNNYFICGGWTCEYQMGPFINGPYRGVWLNVNVVGRKVGFTRWVQTYISTDGDGNGGGNIGEPNPDCAAACPFYPTHDGDPSNWFLDDPARNPNNPVIWVAQTSLMRLGQPGAAFTFMWGFTLSGTGSFTYIYPQTVIPWALQQQQIQAAQ